MKKGLVAIFVFASLSASISLKSFDFDEIKDFAINQTKKINECVRETYKYLYQSIFHNQDAKEAKKQIIKAKITHPDNKKIKKIDNKTDKIIKKGSIKDLAKKANDKLKNKKK